ncbi:glycosyltransferase family 2 protein [Tessaracoccus oleiagri]|uniref:Glycosyltransferase involved in cell wall bisynthesis n=1 Tax=Tessaracoccus oleiagri TaxID=686624 RepID=A0A1G9HE01_9ACTN|nr:glycosyltransferase [Tessaracoccus oleiagri]SDL11075.1 Glycosyltransferase involved in cell wall bisynthesis [Tessaracoccus oleiagri]
MPPLLSVIVPAHRVAEYLPACLDSILGSTLRDLEVVVVDDGSPDETGAIADRYAQRDSRVRVLHTPNQGVGPARDDGVRAATGKYLAFADSDDLVPEDAYEALVGSLEVTGSDFAAGNAWRLLPDEGLVPSWVHKDVFDEDRPRTHLRAFPALVRDRMVWNKVFRRSFWEQGGYTFPAMRYEDYPVAIRTHLDARSVDVLSRRVYIWRQRAGEGSITQQALSVDNVRDRISSAEMVLDMVASEDEQVRDLVHAHFVAVDMTTLAHAIAAATGRDRAELRVAAVAFARRVAPRFTGVTRFSKVVYRLLRAGLPEAAAQLTRWRDLRGVLAGRRPGPSATSRAAGSPSPDTVERRDPPRLS